MAGTIEGGLKAKKTNLKLHGKDFYKRIGKIGGRNGHTGGFASDKVGKDGLTGAERAKIAGKKAGAKSKRGYKFIRQEEGFREYLDKKTGKVVQFPA